MNTRYERYLINSGASDFLKEKPKTDDSFEYYVDPYENEIFYEESVEKTAGNIMTPELSDYLFIDDDE